MVPDELTIIGGVREPRHHLQEQRRVNAHYFTMKISFGALSDPLHKQLDVPPSALEFEQKMADGLTLCIIHGILTDAEGHKARRRLTKRIDTTLKEKGFYE